MRLNWKSVVGSSMAFVVALASTNAMAADESLSFRRSTANTIEAVVAGKDNLCGIIFGPASQISVTGASIVITSPPAARDCGLPLYPPINYSVTANLANLTGSTYHVVWIQPLLSNGTPLQVAADLDPAAVGGGAQPVSAPTLSWLGISMLMLGLIALGTARWRRPMLSE